MNRTYRRRTERTTAPLTALALLLAACGNTELPAGHEQHSAMAPFDADQVDAACPGNEQPLFHCQTGDHQLLSLCAPEPLAPGSRIRYRIDGIGADGPAATRTGFIDHDLVRMSSTGYAGGGEARIRFALDDEEYTVFERTIRTGFDPGGGNDPEFSAGVVVAGDDGHPVTHLCDNAAAIDAIAYRDLIREEFELPE